MARIGIEHYLVLTSDIEATRDFYRDALGMSQGSRPPLEFPGYWMYIGATPLIHIAHVAFNAEDPEGVLARLAQHGVEASI